MTIKMISAAIADIPLRRPHVMSLMTVEKVNFLIVRIRGSNGAVGWGEAAFLGGPTWSEEGVESAAAIVERYVGPYLIGKNFTCVEALREYMTHLVRGNHFALAAVEMALFDLLGKTRRLPVYDLLGGRVRDSLPLSWSLASGDPEQELREAEEVAQRGGGIFKFKTGLLMPGQDVGRVRNIREHLGEKVRLRIDANQGWDRYSAVQAIKGMEPYRLEFAEQPVPKWDVEGLSYISRTVSTPLLADESLDCLQSAMQLVRRDAVGMFGIKLTKLGGLLGGKRLAAIAEAAGFPCYVGCMIETGIGNAAYLHFAVSTPMVTLGCELFGPLLLADTITEEEPDYREGQIFLENAAPGLGVRVVEPQLKQFMRGSWHHIK